MPTTILTTTSTDRASLSPNAGDAYFETDTKNYIIYDGDHWRAYNSDSISVQPVANSYSLFLDGTDDHAEVTGSSEIQISYPLTISAWVHPTVAGVSTNNLRTVISWGSTSTGQGRFLGLKTPNNNLSFGSYGSDVTSTTALSLYTWYHVAATVTSGQTNLYINGSLDTTGSNTLNSFTYGKTHVGELYYSPITSSRHFGGNIDELALFNSVLTADEIFQIYNDHNPFDLNSDAGNYSSSSNLKAWWRMGDGTENGSDTTIYDMSANGSSADNLNIVQGSFDNSEKA